MPEELIRVRFYVENINSDICIDLSPRVLSHIAIQCDKEGITATEWLHRAVVAKAEKQINNNNN